MREESIVLKRLLDGLTLRATSVIVTIYGDIVVPRGGTLWMGTLIQICADLGLSETLVRTAVSRLVAAGQLSGVREGRRSYYQLADSAVAEFAEAAELLYGREQPADGWAIHRCELPTDIILKSAMARIGPDLYLRPRHRDETIAIPGLCFTADVTAGLDCCPIMSPHCGISTVWPAAIVVSSIILRQSKSCRRRALIHAAPWRCVCCWCISIAPCCCAIRACPSKRYHRTGQRRKRGRCLCVFIAN